jgi:SAM-dependent methyltransferase
MIGATPFFGFHLPLTLLAARLFGLNRAVVYGASNLSIPPVAPFLATACVVVGARLAGMDVRFDSATAHAPWSLGRDLFLSWLAGAPVVGGALGFLLGLVVGGGAWIRRRRQDPQWALEQEVMRRFSGERRSIRTYVRCKLLLDPVYRGLIDTVPKRGNVVDLGTGLGLAALLLGLDSIERVVLGIDHDKDKLDVAVRGSTGLRVTFVLGDVATYEIPPCDVVLLIDVLHVLPPEGRGVLLGRIRDALAPGGVLVVRDMDTRRRGASWTGAIERLAVGVGWNRGHAPEFFAADDMVASLASLDFDTRVVANAGPLHPGNVLVIARRREGAPQ